MNLQRLRITIGAACGYSIPTARPESDPTSARLDALAVHKVKSGAVIAETEKLRQSKVYKNA